MHGDTNWKYVIDVAHRATRVLQSTQELSTIDDVNRILDDNDDDTSKEGGSFSNAELEYSSTSTDGLASESENNFLNAFELDTNTDEIDTFSHREGTNVERDAEVWLEAMDDYFETAGTCPQNQTMLAIFRLTGDAKIWWKMHCQDLNIIGTSQSWEEIKDAVIARYLPPTHRSTKMNEFFLLCQLSSTLEEYYSKFVTLRRYAPKMTLEQQVARFCQGLIEPLNNRLEALRPTMFQDVFLRAKPLAKEIKETTQGMQNYPSRRARLNNWNNGPANQAYECRPVVATTIATEFPNVRCFEYQQYGHYRNNCPRMTCASGANAIPVNANERGQLNLQRGSFEHPSASCITIRLALELAVKPYDLPASFNASRLTIRLADGCFEGAQKVRVAAFSALDCIKLQRGPSKHPSTSRMIMRLAIELAGKPYDLLANTNASRITKRLTDGCSESPRCVFSALEYVKLQHEPSKHTSASRLVMRLALELASSSYNLSESSNASHITKRLTDGCSKGPRCVFSALNCKKLQRGPFEHPLTSRITIRLALELVGKPYDLPASSNASRLTIRLADGCSESSRSDF
ncbi:hypothetical protein L7F22_013608 [Adiantum nelumboides]|nr:hypothetical protein [Adiantum nelumboides]